MIDAVMLEDLLEDSEAVMLEPRELFDQALIGITDVDGFVAVYDEDRVIELLRQKNGWNEDDARDYYDFNINTGGTGTPVFVDRLIPLGARQ